MAHRDYVTAIVQNILITSLAAGAVGSTAYLAVFNPACASLLTNVSNIQARILTQEGGKTVSSVTIPGQTVAWKSGMTPQEQMLALLEAWNILAGNVTIVRRSTQRHF